MRGSMSSVAEVVETQEVFGPDQAVLDWMVDHRTGFWDSAMKAVTTLGNTGVLTAVAVLAAVVLASNRQWRPALLVSVGSLVGSIVMFGLKQLIARPRPPIPERMVELSSFSFPSGHAMTSTVVYGSIAVSAYWCSDWVRAHRWVLMAAPVLAIAIGISRVYLGAHWMTDVLAGWVFGSIYLAVAAFVVLRTDPAGPPGSRGGPPTSAGTPRSSRTHRLRGRPDKS
ncbi:phosphatase PAP2 family protein [Williamsia sp. 1138]|nr:phosphatase PAP2 family protein [Williamsia sp. 1138]